MLTCLKYNENDNGNSSHGYNSMTAWYITLIQLYMANIYKAPYARRF